MKNKPTTAVIAVAGYGTRMLPITKAIEKCMLPVNNRPVVDYIVEDCVKAGIKKIIFITSKDNDQIKSYYGSNESLNNHLQSKDKIKELERLKAIGADAEMLFIEQPPGDRYGTAIPLYLAKDYLVYDESFVLLMGDDFIVRQDGSSSIGGLIEDWQITNDDHGLIGVEIPKEDVTKYGVLEINNFRQLVGISEKPNVSEAPSNMVNVSKYIFSQTIINHLFDYMKTKPAGEYLITDVINRAIDNGETILVSASKGIYLDCGNLEGWLYANNYLSNN